MSSATKQKKRNPIPSHHHQPSVRCRKFNNVVRQSFSCVWTRTSNGSLVVVVSWNQIREKLFKDLKRHQTVLSDYIQFFKKILSRVIWSLCAAWIVYFDYFDDLTITERNMSLMCSNELLLCADACPEVAPVAARDPAIMTDRRVLEQLLRLEIFSVPSSDYFAPPSTSELQPYMRRVVTTWMLEVHEWFLIETSFSFSFFLLCVFQWGGFRLTSHRNSANFEKKKETKWLQGPRCFWPCFRRDPQVTSPLSDLLNRGVWD